MGAVASNGQNLWMSLGEATQVGAPSQGKAEVAAHIERFVDQADEDGHRLMVRDGYHA